MGGTTFFTYGYGKDAKEAFRRAVEEATWEHGHGGYTGTIAEKSDYISIPESEHKGKNKIKYAQTLIDKEDRRIDDKWGPAGAIRLTGDLEKKLRKRKNLQGKKVKIYLFFGWASE